jgi:hypothetical protein
MSTLDQSFATKASHESSDSSADLFNRVHQQEAEKPSILNSWVHGAVGLIASSESPTRTEVERYATEFIKSVPLFLGKRVGLASSVITYALDEMHSGDSLESQAMSAVTGGLKGGLTKLTFDRFGQKDWGVLRKGLTLGATSRLIDAGLTASNYYSNGEFDPIAGIGRTVTSAGSLSAAGIDAATWLVAPKFGGMLAKSLALPSQHLANSLVPGMFGFTSGSLAEWQRQHEAKEDFDPWTILARGTAEGAVMGLAGSTGALINPILKSPEVIRNTTHGTSSHDFSWLKSVIPTFEPRPAFAIAGGAHTMMSYPAERIDPADVTRPLLSVGTRDAGRSSQHTENAERLFPLDERAKQFIPDIVEKYKVATLNESELRSIVESFPQQERSVATRILEHGLPNSSETLFDAQMKSLRSKLETTLAGNGDSRNLEFVSADNAGWGKAFGYLYRKLAHSGAGIRDPLKLDASARAAILLDDPAGVQYTQGQAGALNKLDKLYILGPAGFEKGINFFDYAQGAEKVKAKLGDLVAEVQQLRSKQPAATEWELVDRVIRGASREQAATLNKNGVFVSTDDQLPGRLAPRDPQSRAMTIGDIASVLNTQKATHRNVEDFLRQYVPDNQAAAAYTLAEQAKHVTYRDMFRYIDVLHEKIKSAGDKDIPTDKLLFENPDSNDSVNLVNYMYRIATGLPRQQFVNDNVLNAMAEKGQLSDRTIVFLDEHILTGDKIGKRFFHIEDSANKSEGVIFAAMLRDRYPLFGDRRAKVPVHCVEAEVMGGVKRPQWNGASEDQLMKAIEYANDSGFTTRQYGDPRVDFLYPTTTSNAALTYPFGMPDNDVSVVRGLGHAVLGLRQSRDPLLRPLADDFKRYVGATVGRLDSPLRVMQLGKLKLGTKEDVFGSWDDIRDGVISQGATLVKVKAFDAFRRLQPEEWIDRQAEYGRIHRLLDLTPRFPLTVLRSHKDGKRMSRFVVSEHIEGEDLSLQLHRLSGQQVSEPVELELRNKTPAILQTNAGMRQMVERAIAERMIIADEQPKELTLVPTPDGGFYAYNGYVARLGDGSKPVWKLRGEGIRREFYASELSDDTYDRLLQAHKRFSTVQPTTREWEFQRMKRRLEWLLEHRRFPDSMENDDLIY